MEHLCKVTIAMHTAVVQHNVEVHAPLALNILPPCFERPGVVIIIRDIKAETTENTTNAPAFQIAKMTRKPNKSIWLGRCRGRDKIKVATYFRDSTTQLIV